MKSLKQGSLRCSNEVEICSLAYLHHLPLTAVTCGDFASMLDRRRKTAGTRVYLLGGRGRGGGGGGGGGKGSAKYGEKKK